MSEPSKAATEARREYKRKYTAANREKINAYARKWRKANPEKVKAIQARYWENLAKRTRGVESGKF